MEIVVGIDFGIDDERVPAIFVGHVVIRNALTHATRAGLAHDARTVRARRRDGAATGRITRALKNLQRNVAARGLIAITRLGHDRLHGFACAHEKSILAVGAPAIAAPAARKVIRASAKPVRTLRETARRSRRRAADQSWIRASAIHAARIGTRRRGRSAASNARIPRAALLPGGAVVRRHALHARRPIQALCGRAPASRARRSAMRARVARLALR